MGTEPVPSVGRIIVEFGEPTDHEDELHRSVRVATRIASDREARSILRQLGQLPYTFLGETMH
jgi:hypothetical protein